MISWLSPWSNLYHHMWISIAHCLAARHKPQWGGVKNLLWRWHMLIRSHCNYWSLQTKHHGGVLRTRKWANVPYTEIYYCYLMLNVLHWVWWVRSFNSWVRGMCGGPVAMGFSKISLFLSLINCIKMVYLAVKIQKILRSLLSFYSAPLVVPRWLTELVPFLCAVIKYMDFKVTISSCITFFYYCFSECCATFRCSKQFFLYLHFFI